TNVGHHFATFSCSPQFWTYLLATSHLLFSDTIKLIKSIIIIKRVSQVSVQVKFWCGRALNIQYCMARHLRSSLLCLVGVQQQGQSPHFAFSSKIYLPSNGKKVHTSLPSLNSVKYSGETRGIA